METDEKNEEKASEKLHEQEARENIERQLYEQRNAIEAQQNQEARDAGQVKDNTEGKHENTAIRNNNVFGDIPDRSRYDQRDAVEAKENQKAREVKQDINSKLEPMVSDYKEMLNLTEDQKNEMLANVYKEAERNPNLGEMQKLAESDIYHEYTQTQLSFETQSGETPLQALDHKLDEIGFHKGEHEGTPLEIMDGFKGGHDNQRFKDIEGGLQEHIRFNEPVENIDGSYSITIIGESHRNTSMEPVYGEGTFGDLEPSRNSIEHLVNTLNWLKNLTF
jgi:hypothetical protein